MELLNFDLLLRILIAHFLSDFILQPTLWAEKKNEDGIKSKYFWLHILITAATLAAFLCDWQLWPVFLLITVSHLIIDALKSKIHNKSIWVFIVDQLIHLFIIFIVWLIFSHQKDLLLQTISKSIDYHKFWFLLLAYISLSIPSSVLIGKMTDKWSKELKINKKDNTEENNESGLKSAGKWIGIMERLLIFTFIAINQISAIGFLLAAKSVFRFGDLKDASDHKKTEYIIIGTFLSFSIAIAIGIIYKFIIK